MAIPPRHIRVRHTGDVTIVSFDDLQKKVHDDEAVAEIGEELFRLAEPGRPSKVLLDFGESPFVPYATFEGKLVSLRRRIQKGGGVLKMAGLHPAVMNHFHLNRLAAFFSIYESEEEALGAFTR